MGVNDAARERLIDREVARSQQNLRVMKQSVKRHNTGEARLSMTDVQTGAGGERIRRGELLESVRCLVPAVCGADLGEATGLAGRASLRRHFEGSPAAGWRRLV